jgi:hypothetical protein
MSRMRRRLQPLLLLLIGVLLVLQTGIGLADAARAHVRCDVHGDMLHTDEAATSRADDDRPSLRAETPAGLHHGCALADAVVPTVVTLPRDPHVPSLRWRTAPAAARAPPLRDDAQVAPLVRAPKTSPPTA